MQRYNPKEIEPKWQAKWEADGIHRATEDPSKPKKYILEYFPYPSGAAMHVGHVRNYAIGDALARHARMQGYNVLHPMGWDGFGLPAENYAIKNNVSPRQAIDDNTDRFKKQLTQMGFGYDWSREIDSTDPNYYRWTQWFFNLLFKRGLAYQKESLQWWCPHDKTVLANEQVEAGVCWRCGNAVEKKALKQWFFKITDYADRLEKDLDDVNWSDSIKAMQRNWIGRSKGAEIEFVIGDTAFDVKDTLKFTPELTDMIQRGEKWSTIRLEPKALAVGDYAKLQTRFDEKEVRSFATARIKDIKTLKLRDIANDYPGHEKYDTDDEKLADYQRYYGDKITLDTEFTIYDFKKSADIVTVFTTRPDTLFGATFMVVAPEHPLVQRIATDEQRDAVEQYVKDAQAKTDIQRQETDREKTGVFTGAYAINPINNEKIPVWIADYVLYGYGTGAIMAVPAHDERDYAFAQKFKLPIKQVVASYEEYTGEQAPRSDVETIKRRTIDAIIRDASGRYLLETEGEQTHFVGGGIDDEDLSDEDAIRREVLEETGYTDIASIRQVAPYIAGIAYRHTKNKNQQTWGAFYEVTLGSMKQVASEADQGMHTLSWVSEEKVLDKITWSWHADAWRHYKAELSAAYHDSEGVLVNSGTYDWMTSSTARERIVADLEKLSAGKEVTNYKIRDWLISRQRYWGAPIPIVHCPQDGAVAVPDDQLPVKLPEIESYEPSGDGRSPLATVKEFVETTCPKCGGPAERETDTMDGFACSSWYFLRFADPHNDKAAFDPAKAKFWLPVDDYIGGAEHAVMHLLYARMWTKVMYDEGLIDFNEPFKTLRNQGMILAPDGNKMSKSKGNTIEPDGIIEQGYGADSIRIMELFIGPWNQAANWSVEGMGGAYRFLQRIWTLTQEYIAADKTNSEQNESVSQKLAKIQHATTKKVSEDLHDLSFNTAIATLMQAVNDYYKVKAENGYSATGWKEAIESLLQLLAPFAPHITEELWSQVGHDGSIHTSQWPTYDEKYLVEDMVTIVAQVNGKVRAQLQLPAGSAEADIVAQAKADANIMAHLEGKQVVKTIFVPNKLVNFVVK